MEIFDPFFIGNWARIQVFEPLIGFLVFLVQRLWHENNKLINYLIRRLIILLFLGRIF